MAPLRQSTPLGALLKSERRSQVWLAQVVGVQPRAVWTWVHGIHEPNEDTKRLVAAALDTSTDALWPHVEDVAA